jgi:hypothetical protein
MTNERAIEILDPEHRGHYESIEPVNEACRIGMNAIKRVHELEAENAELHKALDEIKVFGLEMKNGEVDMTVGSDTFNYITAMLVQMLEQNNAKNFLTTAIEVGNQKYSVTVQKNGGKTPSEELSELKTENASLRARLEKAVELPCKVGDKVYGVGFTDCEDSRTTDEKKKRQIFNVCMKMGGNCEKCKYRRPQIEEFVCTHIQLGDCGIEGKSILIVGDRNENYTANNVFTTSEAAEARLAELKGE